MSNMFLGRKLLLVDSKFTQILSDEQGKNIGSVSGLGRNRQQGVTWRNDDPLSWNINAGIWDNEWIGNKAVYACGQYP